jgi:cobalamin biosynthetic protein CobC
VWQRLPETDDGLEAAAAAYYGSGPAAGGRLPGGDPGAAGVLCAGPGITLAPTYAEHPHAWRGHQLRRSAGIAPRC